MRVHPDLNIFVPPSREDELVKAMKELAVPPWGLEQYDSVKDPDMVEEYLWFRRDAVGDDAGWNVHVKREPGKLVVVDANVEGVFKLSVDEYVRVLRQFDKDIAEPAAERVEGMTSIDTDKRRLEDYFSPEAVALLEHFCTGSNKSALGSHPSDQEKWMKFLLEVHRTNACTGTEYVHCDTFGGCLKATGWWPEEGIQELVNEYEFAMELLRMADAMYRDNRLQCFRGDELAEIYRKEHEEKLGRPVWGEWEYDPQTLCLISRSRGGEIDMTRMINSAQVLDWIFHLDGKGWVTPKIIAEFLEAVRFLIDPQENLCSWGENKTFDAKKHLKRLFKGYC